MRTLRQPAFQFGHHEVVEITAFVVARPSHRENVVAQPTHQQRNIVGQCDGLGA